MSRKLFWPITIIVSAIFAGILAWSNPGWLIQQLILFWFILICPGMAIIGLLHLDDHLTELILAVALSLVLGILVAEFMLLTRQWSPPAILAILIGISFAGAVLQIRNLARASITTRE